MKKNLKNILLFFSFFCLFIIILIQKKEIDYKEKKEKKFRLYYDTLNKWIKNLLEGFSIELKLKENNYQTIGIYGIGEIGQRLYDSLKDSDIIIKYIIDQGNGYFDEIELRNLNENLEEVDLIIITPIYDYENIKNQIKKIYPNYCVVSIMDILDMNIGGDLDGKI